MGAAEKEVRVSTTTLVALSPDEMRELVREVLREELGKAPPRVPPGKYVDARELGKHYSVSRGTVHNWIRFEDCPHIMHGKVLRFELAAVEAWFRGRDPSLKRVK